MKKLFAILTALCLLLCCAATAETYVNWSDFEAQIAESGLEGNFYTFDEIAVKLWVPNFLMPGELTDQDKEDGYIGWFTSEDQSAQIAVMYVPLGGMSLEEYGANLEEAGAVGVGYGTINGLPTVSYQMPDNNSVNVAFTTEAGYVLEIIMFPADDEGAVSMWTLVAASIQPE